MPFPKNIFLGNAIPPNDIRTRGNGDAVALKLLSPDVMKIILK